MATINFVPGPSQMYFTVEDHVRQAFKDGIPSLSHRSKAFEKISKEATEGLTALLNIPSGYYFYFTGSANEIWERIIQNLVEDQSFHLVNGSFSKRFFEIAQLLNKHPTKAEVENGKGFASGIQVPAGTELIAVTHNETSTGVCLPLETIYKFKEDNPTTLLAVDAVSSLPFPDFDYTKLDTVFFSVQKGFGLPAGLGVWMVNEKCIEKSERLLAKGISIGSYHNIPGLQTHALKHQTPETPNVFGIYLLGKVVKDMLRRGIKTIRQETEYKATLLYQTLQQHNLISPAISDATFQSKTVIVANTGEHTEKITNYLLGKGMQPGDGYGPSKKSQLRFANFPTHSKEQFELLADSLKGYAG